MNRIRRKALAEIQAKIEELQNDLQVLMTGEDPMHADDDRVVRCDAYRKEA